jgi:polyisoprenoid-binding protein YceI
MFIPLYRFLLSSCFVWSGIALSGQRLVPVKEGSTVTFTIRNLGFNVGGSFTGIEGNIFFDTADLGSSSFDVSIDANSINTGIDMRDNHLRDSEYLDAVKFPRIHFLSTQVRASKPYGNFWISGKLTIKDQTRPISFPFLATVSGDDILFKGQFKINRKDFGVGRSSTISDNMELSINVLAKNVKK